MVDASPFGKDVGSLSLSQFNTSYAALLYAAGRTGPLAVVPVAGQLSYDSRRSPYATATLTIAWPSESVLKTLDPVEQQLTMEVYASYVRRSNNVTDQQRLALLRVQSCVRDYVAGTVTITAASDEVCVVDTSSSTAHAYTTSSGVVAAIQDLVADALPGESQTWVVDSGLGAATFAAAQQVDVGDDRWNLITDWADSMQAKVWHDGVSTWHVSIPPSAPNSSTDAYIKVGEDGTITELQIASDRSGNFASEVVLVYTYSVGGVQKFTSCVATTSLRPVKSITVTRRGVTPHNAARAANNLLRRGLRRYYQVAAKASAAYWLRPWDTLAIKAPRGLNISALVDAVTFDLAAADMELTCTRPIADHLPLITVSAPVTSTVK